MDTVTDMPEGVPRFALLDDYDGERLTPDTDPLDAYLNYRENVRLGRVREMGFTLTDFRDYIAFLYKCWSELRSEAALPDLQKNTGDRGYIARNILTTSGDPKEPG